MNYLSVCSGIEAASVAWEPLGFTPFGFAEIEPFPCSVLQHRFPGVPNFGDMTRFEDWPDGTVDVLVGGTPCQSFSIAGLRGGLSDERGNLALVYCRILQRYRPRWFVWENVPGVLSSNGGRDFGSILGAVAELGYSFAWRILDAQYWGVPQRRRRVFLVGHSGNVRYPAEVLFEPNCVRRDPETRRKKRQKVAALTATGVGTCGADDNQGQAGHIIPSITAHYGRGPDSDCTSPLITHTLRGEGFDASEDGTGRGIPLVSAYRTAGDGCVYSMGDKTAPLTTNTDPSATVIAIQERAVSTNTTNGPQGAGLRTDGKAYTLEARHHVQAVEFAENSRNEVRLEGGNGDRTWAVSTGGGKAGQGRPTIAGTFGVRRLTPLECSRLQGFPDDYLELKYGTETKAHTAQVLHELWKTVNSFAREGWRSGIAASLLTPQILLAGVHGGWVSWEMAGRCASARGKIPGEKVWPENFVRELWINSQRRSSPYRRESFEQLERESQGLVSGLSYERTQAEAFLLSSGLWEEAQRAWPLRYALATPSQIASGKMNPDGPRYKAIGNSMAVPVMRWIGNRIMEVEQRKFPK